MHVKAIVMAVTLSLIVGLFTVCFSETTQASPFINVSSTQVDPGGTVTASYSHTGDTPRAWIGLHRTSEDSRNYIAYEYLRDLSGSQWVVDMPTEPGTYEFRLFADGSYGNLLATSPSVTVGAGHHTVTVSPVLASPGDNITATFTSPAHSNAWIGFYSKEDTDNSNSPERDYIEYEYIRNLSGNTYTVTAPNENGEYFFWLFGTGAYNNKLAASPIVTVQGAAIDLPPHWGILADRISTGFHLRWNPREESPPVGVIGYRLFRSESPDELGISVTDFFLATRIFTDVNVKPGTTYYYTIKPVLREADPQNNIEEQLGAALATTEVTTPGDLLDSDALRRFIVMQLNNPMMTVDGAEEEIDPGRGTTPVIRSGRTLVPIRAAVQAMGGLVGYNAGEQKVTLEKDGTRVEMWIGESEFLVDGEMREMDVVPIIENGRTFIPVRFATTGLNAEIDWLSSTSEIIITF